MYTHSKKGKICTKILILSVGGAKRFNTQFAELNLQSF